MRALRSERSVRVGSLVAGSLTAWGIGGLAALSAHLDATSWTVGESELLLAPVVTIWVLLLFGAPALEAIEVATLAGACPARPVPRPGVGGLQANTVLAATATLGALAYPVLNAPTVLLMALPLLAAKLGFDRNAETRTHLRPDPARDVAAARAARGRRPRARRARR